MSDTFDEFEPFRGLPITREQDAEIRRYIRLREGSGAPWDTLMLDYIIKDMLYPAPSDDRIESCDLYARNLVNRIRRTGETLESYTRETHAEAYGPCTEAEWKWIVREAGLRLLK